jgi:hypothetical protein
VPRNEWRAAYGDGLRLGIADRANDTITQISKAADVIDDVRCHCIGGIGKRWIEQQGIDREIAPQDVLFCIVLESDFRGMPAVHIRMVASKGGDFHSIDEHHAKLGSHQLGSGKNLY